jgi:hypothetical protein
MHAVVVLSKWETTSHVMHVDVHELDRDEHGVDTIFIADVYRFLSSRLDEGRGGRGQSLAPIETSACCRVVET